MGASEWHKAAVAYEKKVPDIAADFLADQYDFDLDEQMKTKLIEFLNSSLWKTAQEMLRAGKRSIFLGRLSFNLSSTIDYYLGALGLHHNCPCGGCSNFEATPLDAVRAFYWYDQHKKNVDMVEWIKEMLDDMAGRMLKEASKGE